MRTKKEVEHAFTPVKTLTQSQQQMIYLLQKAQTDNALEVMELVPDCADRTAGMRLLLQAKQIFIQAITHQPPVEAKLNPPTTNKEPANASRS